MSLAGKIALVSGGNRGIGRAIVERLAGAGCQVLFLGRNESENRQVEAEINRISRMKNAHGGKIVHVASLAAEVGGMLQKPGLPMALRKGLFYEKSVALSDF